jgi:hypothetical protein
LNPKKVGYFPVSLVAQSSQRADAIRKDLRVDPEGIRQEQVFNGVLKGATEIAVDLTFPEPLYAKSRYPWRAAISFPANRIRRWWKSSPIRKHCAWR